MKSLLAHLAVGRTLSRQEAIDAFEQIMTGAASPPQTAALLAMMQLRGPTVEEIAGAASVMRRHVKAVTVPGGVRVVDTCGTGGDHARTFNISTAAALVAAGAGRAHQVAVAKHGNRSVTSKSGSSQVLEALGVKLRVTDQTLGRCLEEAGVCFCFAPAHHPAMKYAAPIRAELGMRTIFNILGPLTNPAGVRHQLIGVFDPDLTEPMGQVLADLGTEHGMVVHGAVGESGAASGGHSGGGGIDELTTTGLTRITTVREGKVSTSYFDACSLGLEHSRLESLQVDSVEASAEVVRGVLGGEGERGGGG